jgi:MFS family permease
VPRVRVRSGYFPPYYFIPTYIRDMHPSISPQLATLPVALMNFSAAAGRTMIGYTADRIGPTNSLILAVTCSGLSQLLFWNFATGYGAIVTFVIIYGFFGGCFISLLTPVAARMFGTAKLATLSGLLILFNAPGKLLRTCAFPGTD